MPLASWLADVLIRLGMALADRVIEAEDRKEKASLAAARKANEEIDALERAKFGSNQAP